jgi:hypothetical protein
MGIPFDALQVPTGPVDAGTVNRLQANVAHAFSLIPDPVGLDVSTAAKDFTVGAEAGVVVLDTAPRSVTLFLPAPNGDRTVLLMNQSAYAAKVRTRDAKQTFDDVAAGAIAMALCDGSKWYVSDSLGGTSSPASGGGTRPPAPPAAPTDALYWLSQANAALPSAVDMGALGLGILQQTSVAGVAIPSAFAGTPGSVLYVGPDGLLAQDSAHFFYDAADVLWGFGTNTPSPSVTMTIQRAVDGAAGVFATNSSAGTSAAAGFVAQAATSDAYTTAPKVALSTLGRNFVPPASEAFFLPGTTMMFAETDTGVLFAHASPTVSSYGWRWVAHNIPMEIQELRMQLSYAGALSLPATLSDTDMSPVDHLVYATLADGTLTKVALGSGLALVAGTLSATGSGGTVTDVSATLPLTSSHGATPDIALTYNGSLTLDGSNQLQRAALTGAVTAAAGSNTTAFGALAALSVLANATGGSAVPSALAASSNGDVLRMAGGVLGWGAIPESSVTNLVTDLAALVPKTTAVNTTAPLTGGGALSASLTLGIADFVASGASHARGAVPDPGAVAGTAKFLREDATWGVPPGTGVPTSRTLAATAPLLIDGGHGPLDLSANRTFAHDTSGVGAGTSAWATVQVDAYGHVTGIAAGSWPTADQVVVSNGSAPIGYAELTYDGTKHALRNDGPFTLNAAPDAITTHHLITVAPTATRDQARFNLGGVTVSDGVSRELFSISPAAALVSTSTIGLAATARIRAAAWSTSVAAITETAGLYVDSPTVDGNTTPVFGGTDIWVIHAAGTGISKFDGGIVTGGINATLASFGSGGQHSFTTTGLQFYTALTPVAQQTVTGSRGGNAALASLLNALAATGLVVDSTTP